MNTSSHIMCLVNPEIMQKVGDACFLRQRFEKRGECMFTLNSILQTLFQFVKAMIVSVSKQVYRNAAVLSAGCLIVIVAVSSAGFAGGKRTLAYAKTYYGDDGLEPGQEALLAGESRKDGLYSPKVDAEAFADAALHSDPSAVSRQLSGQTGFEEYGQFAEGKTEQDESSFEFGRALIGDVLKQDTREKLESERTVRERVGQAQKEIRVQQVKDAAEKAAEEVKRKEEEARKAALRIPYSEEDYQVMLKIVQAEAGGCDNKGKILVANVIMNRVRSREFPDSITGVVYERSQFSPVSDGSINQVHVTQDTVQCVNRALEGEDYSQGALYFMNRKASYRNNVTWFDRSLTFLFSHGGHEFFK